MRPTSLVYSSHDRCEYLHKEFIIQRALESWDNKTLLHLPFSQKTQGSQEWDFGNFRWYYSNFSQYGLKATPFYWNDYLRREDVDTFFHMLWSSQVVLLGGGNSSLGLRRFKDIGQMYYNDRDLFSRILHERKDRGLLTVGFSAGADQLCQFLSSSISHNLEDPHGFGLCRNICATLHHEPGREEDIYKWAVNVPHILSFGLPNDSGIGTAEGYLHSGNIWQIISFITDNSWDVERDQWHIKTKMGVKIEHFYCDGRTWSFNGGDIMVRVMSPDNNWQTGTIITSQGAHYDYWSQNRVHPESIQDILSRY